MKRKITAIQLLLCSLMLPCTTAFSAGYFDIIGAASLSQVNAGNSLIGVTSDETDTLVQTNDNFRHWDSWGVQFGLGYVYFLGNAQRFSNSMQWFPSIEPQLNVYFNDYQNKGNVYRFGSPAFNELNYKERILSTRLMLDFALTLASIQQFSVYIKAGVGNGWNEVSYSDSVNGNTDCDLEGLNLGSRDTSHFAWEAGAGIIYAANNMIGVSFEYLYTDFGKLKNQNSNNITGLLAPTTSASSFNFHTQAFLLGVHLAV